MPTKLTHSSFIYMYVVNEIPINNNNDTNNNNKRLSGSSQ